MLKKRRQLLDLVILWPFLVVVLPTTFIFHKTEVQAVNLRCPSQSHWATVSLNYSQSIKINIWPSDSGTIVPSTHRSTILYWRLLDFRLISKFELSEKHTKFEKNPLDTYLVKVQTMRKIAQIFVCFSESLNFKVETPQPSILSRCTAKATTIRCCVVVWV
jgi:hypothetical protein